MRFLIWFGVSLFMVLLGAILYRKIYIKGYRKGRADVLIEIQDRAPSVGSLVAENQKLRDRLALFERVLPG